MLFGIDGVVFGLIAGVLSCLGGGVAYLYLLLKTEKDVTLEKIAIDVKSMVDVFVWRMDSTVFLVACALGIIISISGIWFGPITAWSGAFVALGSLFSIIAGVIGMNAGSHTSHRVTYRANKNKGRVGPPLQIAFLGASVMALIVPGLATIGITLIIILTGELSLVFIGAFSMGATLTAVFSKNGGGMFSKGMDMAADLSGKVIAGLPEDHPMNPASKGDNAGDYVCDIKGTGLDMYDSYVAAIFAAFTVIYAISPLIAHMTILFVGIGIISTLIGISVFLTRKIDKNPSLALSLAVYTTYGIFSLLAGVVFLLSPELSWKLFVVLIAGPIISGIVIGISTNYFTGGKPVRQTGENGKINVALAMASGLEIGHMSVPIPALAIVVTIGIGFFFGGIEGVALATLGLMANMGMNVGVDVFGPIADNAKGLAEQAGLHSEAIDTLDLIDATGNTTAAYAKGIANGCAGLSMVTLLVAFFEVLRKKMGPGYRIDLMENITLVKFVMGGLLGVASSCLFAAMTMAPARKIAFKVMDNIKKQFAIKSVQQRMLDNDKPDYKVCANIGTDGALKNLNPPVLIVVFTTLAIRFILGPIALVAYIYGSNLVNFAIGFWMSTAGGNWDNAKKDCEAGNLGEGHGKGSETHKALVACDTVGDPLKDITGPGMNSMSALQSLIAIMSIELFPLWYLF